MPLVIAHPAPLYALSYSPPQDNNLLESSVVWYKNLEDIHYYSNSISYCIFSSILWQHKRQRGDDYSLGQAV